MRVEGCLRSRRSALIQRAPGRGRFERQGVGHVAFCFEVTRGVNDDVGTDESRRRRQGTAGRKRDAVTAMEAQLLVLECCRKSRNDAERRERYASGSPSCAWAPTKAI